MASRLGDQTARLQGRVTLNPIYHIDPVGTLIIPAIIIFGPFIGFSLFSGILIGWAKPTPGHQPQLHQDPPRREYGDPGGTGVEPVARGAALRSCF